MKRLFAERTIMVHWSWVISIGIMCLIAGHDGMLVVISRLIIKAVNATIDEVVTLDRALEDLKNAHY